MRSPPDALLRVVAGLATADEAEKEAAQRGSTQGIHSARKAKQDALHAALKGKPRVRVKAICVRIDSAQVSSGPYCYQNGYALMSWPSQRRNKANG